jgi:hypothetical protein
MLKRQDVAASVEPTQCFYIEQSVEIIGQREMDLTIDLAPDRQSKSTFPIRSDVYKALGVLEL